MRIAMFVRLVVPSFRAGSSWATSNIRRELTRITDENEHDKEGNHQTGSNRREMNHVGEGTCGLRDCQEIGPDPKASPKLCGRWETRCSSCPSCRRESDQ
jgi:hypothetical protein